MVTKAAMEAQAAQVRYLIQLVAYERVLAPFDGVTTVRDVDIGSLVAANTPSGAEMFTTGLYGVVHLDVPRVAPVALVPSQAVIFDQNGLNAAVYDNGVLRLRHLDVLADDGAQLEAQAGLKRRDLLVLNPPQIAMEGMRVVVSATAEKPK